MWGAHAAKRPEDGEHGLHALRWRQERRITSLDSVDMSQSLQRPYSPLIFSPVVPACLRSAWVKAWHAVVLPVPLRPTAHTLWSLLVPTMDTYTRLTRAARAGGASHMDSPRRDFGV